MRKSRQIVLNLIVLILMVLNPLSSFSSTAVYAQSISDSNSAATVDVIARKLWQGGPEEKPELWFRLMFEEGEDLEVVPGVLPKEITDTENEVTWFSLPKYNAEGTEIIYKVQEGIWDYLEEEFEEGVPEGYRARYSFDGLTIRNIFIEDEVQPPALDPVIRETEIPVTTPEPPEGPGDEAPIDLPVITPEPDEPPLEEPRLSSPVTASINWQGGEVPRPVFWLKLQKTDASGNLTDVPGASLIQANLATRVTWANIADYGESTDYTVVVVDSAGAPYTLPGYITSIEGLSVTFTYEEHTTTELVAELEWLASLEPKEFIDFSQYPDYQTPPVYLRLYRQTNESDEPIALLSTTLIELTHGTTTAIWYNMPTANSDGLPYIYSVKQVDANGNDFIPEGFEKIETGLLVQNVVLDGDNNPLIIDPGPYHTYNFYVQDNANDWQIEETQTVTNGAWLDRPEDPNKENHKFIGWFTDETAGIEFTNFGIPITVTENQTINLYARFVEQYTVTFYKHDGAVYKVVADVPGTVVTTTGVSYEVGQDLVVVGWSLTPAPAPQTPVYEVTIGYEPIALYPIVSNVYTIVFNSNLPHDNPSYTPPVYVVPGEAIQAPTNPTVVGYTFAGWNTQADGTGDMVSFPYTPVSNITLYAQWTPQQVNFKIIVYKEVLDGNGYVTNPTQYTAHTILEKQVLAGSELTPSYIISQIGTNDPGNLYEFDHAEGVSHVVGDGSTVVGAYYKLKVYEFRFDLIHSDTSLTIGGQTYTGSEYYFNARMGENIASKWPTDVTGYMLSGVQYQFYAWYNSNIGSYFVTKRFNITTDMVPNPNTTSAIVFNAQYQTGMTQRQVNYYLQNVND